MKDCHSATAQRLLSVYQSSVDLVIAKGTGG